MTTQDLGIVEILSSLEEENLMTLARTVTQGLLKINSTEEAVKGILKYSPDVLSILRRKAITREVLFSYLDEKNVVVKLPITKNELIDKILECWNVSPISSSRSNSSTDISHQKPQETSTEISKKEDANSIQALAEQFATWFYSLMNSEGVGSEHFYSDAKLKINLYANNDCDSTVIENDPEDIAKQLFKVKIQHNLLFNPNISKEGTQGRMNPHGLVMVLVCGTLHVQETCVGVFEQVFALARDPFCDNNWKIKNSELNLRSQGQIMGQPRLCDSELTSGLLSLPSS
ncbi:unnamed protein product [Psylliodes chrysocephalus]|uniref:NTF2 domain-containing protein n=1 Tax=Psylliodes chrysocephalus TaxID=3402493 RepID=A0A9P0CP94_9CUCU|nr:unnamed protein product [Psylliodes chrysocephala]